jgi:hypothetical protein
VAGFGITDVEPSVSTTAVFVWYCIENNLKGCHVIIHADTYQHISPPSLSSSSSFIVSKKLYNSVCDDDSFVLGTALHFSAPITTNLQVNALCLKAAM